MKRVYIMCIFALYTVSLSATVKSKSPRCWINRIYLTTDLTNMSDTTSSYESYIDNTGILQVWWRMVLQQGNLIHNTFGNSKFLPLPLVSPPSRSRSESTDFLSDSTSSESEGWAASRPLTPPDNKIIQRQLNSWALSWEVSLHPPIPFHPHLSPPLLGPPHCCVINSQAPAGGGGGLHSHYPDLWRGPNLR